MGAKVKAGGSEYGSLRLVQVGLTPDQRAWLEAQAKAEGVGLSQIIRDLVDQAR